MFTHLVKTHYLKLIIFIIRRYVTVKYVIVPHFFTDPEALNTIIRINDNSATTRQPQKGGEIKNSLEIRGKLSLTQSAPILALQSLSSITPRQNIILINKTTVITLAQADMHYVAQILTVINDPSQRRAFRSITPSTERIQIVLSLLINHNIIPEILGNTLTFTDCICNLKIPQYPQTFKVNDQIVTLFNAIAASVDRVNPSISDTILSIISSDQSMAWDNFRITAQNSLSSTSTEYNDVPTTLSQESLRQQLDATIPKKYLSLVELSTDSDNSTLLNPNKSQSDTSLLTENFSLININPVNKTL